MSERPAPPGPGRTTRDAMVLAGNVFILLALVAFVAAFVLGGLMVDYQQSVPSGQTFEARGLDLRDDTIIFLRFGDLYYSVAALMLTVGLFLRVFSHWPAYLPGDEYDDLEDWDMPDDASPDDEPDPEPRQRAGDEP